MRQLFTIVASAAIVCCASSSQAHPPPPAAGEAVPATATIRGHVVAADTGRPLRRAQVRINSADGKGPGVNRLATTDADGRYEFSGLGAGRYYLFANKSPYVQLSYAQRRSDDPLKGLSVLAGQTVERVDFVLPRGAVVTGRIVDEFGEPISRLQVSVVRSMFMNGTRRLVGSGSSTTDDLGEFRVFGIVPGRYQVEAVWRNQDPNPAPGARADDHAGYATTFFPGVTDAAKAQRFTLAAGDIVSDLAFTMVPVKTTNITGSVVDSEGRPVTGFLMVQQDAGAGYASTGGPIRADGTFTIAGLPPGDYTLRATPGRPPGPDGEVAEMKIAANGEDIADVRMIAVGPVMITGRIVVDPSATTPNPPRTTVTATRMDAGIAVGTSPGRMNNDGTFAVPARPGRNRIVLAAGGPDWQIRSVRIGGVDVTDGGFDVAPSRGVDGVEVEVTNRLTIVTGTAIDSRGAAQTSGSATIVVFSSDSKRWTPGSRYVRIARSDSDGRFKITGLPPGEYNIAAVGRVDDGETTDPEFLDRLQTSATSFSIADGESRTLDLRVTSVP